MAKKKAPSSRKKAVRKSSPTAAAKSTSSTPSSSSLKPWQRQALLHGSLILAFFIIVVGYFKPLMIDGDVVNQHDIISFQGMAQETREFRAETGEEALWVSTLFSGMPAYQTSTRFSGDFFFSINQLLWFGIPRPANYIFLTFLGFYFLMLTLGANPWMSAGGAAAFAFSTYFIVIHGPGHSSKANAIAYMAPVLAGVLMAYRGKILLGAAITAFFFALEVSANHYQITYYLGIALIIVGISYAIDAIRNDQIPGFLKASGALVLAGALGMGPSIGKVMLTMEYAEESTRGKAELTENIAEAESGLDKEYALRWSNGVSETFNMLIPNFVGGGNYGDVGKNEVYDLLTTKARQNSKQAERTVQNWPTYWGDQPGVAGPVYVGAIICFLFVLGLFVVPARLRWALLGITLVSILFSWGRNFPALTDLLWHTPGYNKFRAPAMFLVIAQLSMPIMAVLALKEFFSPEGKSEELLKKLYMAAGITAGLCLILALLGPAFMDFENQSVYNDTDKTLTQFMGAENPQQIIDFIDATVADRQTMLRSDAFRSILLILLAAGIMFFYTQAQNRGNARWYLLGIAALMIFDLVQVDRRYFNDNNYITQREYDRLFQPKPADQAIIQAGGADPNYRIMDFTLSTFNDARTSYFHKHVGGYHAAKLRRYSDVIVRQINAEQQQLGQIVNQPDSIRNAGLRRLQVLNMLNCEFFKFGDAANQVLQNPAALGHAWMVQNIQLVNSPDEELVALSNFDARTTAIVDQNIFDGYFGEQVQGFSYQPDPTASISLKEFAPNRLLYQSNCQSEQIAVFSEIYYNQGKGWNAYVDGEKVPHFRANYLLRAMRLKPGSHEIEFRFEPATYARGNTLSMIFSLILLLGVLAVLYLTYKEEIMGLIGKKEAQD